jgi:enamine deaminase RidA (YjgF/YER057c/UK114 family)
MVTFTNPPTVHAPAGSYSHTAVVPANTELVFLSGQVGARPDGSTPLTLAEQADQAFSNIVQLLAAHGLQPDAIVKLTLFIVAGQDIQVVRNARIKHLGNHRPTSTAVFVSQLADPKWFVEVEAVAARSTPK